MKRTFLVSRGAVESPAAPSGDLARSYRSLLRRLGDAQKPASRSAPAYSRFVNRRIGRHAAVLCLMLGLTPNAVSAVSAGFTAVALVLLVTFPPSWGLGVTVAAALLVGYAFDSADGQVARFTRSSSAAGEWLDHFIDAIKATAIPIALLIGLYRFTAVPVEWLLVPLLAAVVSSALFFAMVHTDILRRLNPIAHPAAERSSAGSRDWLRAVAVAPMDYGVLCLSFALLGAMPLFVVVYSFIVLATTLFLGLAAVKWYRELATPVHQGVA